MEAGSGGWPSAPPAAAAAATAGVVAAASASASIALTAAASGSSGRRSTPTLVRDGLYMSQRCTCGGREGERGERKKRGWAGEAQAEGKLPSQVQRLYTRPTRCCKELYYQHHLCPFVHSPIVNTRTSPLVVATASASPCGEKEHTFAVAAAWIHSQRLARLASSLSKRCRARSASAASEGGAASPISRVCKVFVESVA